MQKDNENIFSFIKERAPIFNVISEHVSLKKAGLYWKGPCPFHDEKTASFTVSPSREIFYCFGCHTGGDVITFVAKIENCTPLEAAKYLADRYNIAIPQSVTAEISEAKIDEKKRYFEICELFAQWAHKELEKHPSITSYLEKRGLNKTSVDQFMVGYFPGGERNVKDLVKDLNKQNLLAKDLIDVHIIEQGKTTLYSPFEQRIIFPIRDHLGRYCGFGGRVIRPDDERPKYYNSRETSFFQKGALLFGMDLAKKSIQKTGHAFLVEGYTDCIAMAQHGLTNTVATLGTACTLEHLKLLSYHAHTVYLVYDGDAAGQKAMLRLAELCWQVNLELKTIFLPMGQDPASFLQEGNDIRELVPQALDILEYFLANLGQEFKTQTLQQKLENIKTFLEVLKRLDDPLKQSIFLQKACETFKIPLEALQKQLDKTFLGSHGQPQKETPLPADVNLIDGVALVEKKFMRAILSGPELLQRKEVAQLIEYMPLELQAIVKKLEVVNVSQDKNTFIHFFDTLEYPEKQIVNRLLLSQEEQGETQDFEQLLLLIGKKYWKMIVNGTKHKIAQAQQDNDAQQVNELVVSFLTLKEKLIRKGVI